MLWVYDHYKYFNSDCAGINFGNGLAIWHGFPNIRHIKVNNGRKSAILNLIELKFFRAYPSLKPHILFYNKGLAVWYGVPGISNIKIKLLFADRYSSNSRSKAIAPQKYTYTPLAGCHTLAISVNDRVTHEIISRQLRYSNATHALMSARWAFWFMRVYKSPAFLIVFNIFQCDRWRWSPRCDRPVCVKYEMNFPMGFRDMPLKRKCGKKPAGRGDAITFR